MKKIIAVLFSLPLLLCAAEANVAEEPSASEIEELFFGGDGSLSLGEDGDIDEDADKLFEDSAAISMGDKEEELEKLFK